jgi:hypothetical protein
MTLALELVNYILSFTDPKTLARFEMTCKNNYENPYQYVWKQFLLKEIQSLNCKLPDQRLVIINYKKTYLMIVNTILRFSMYLHPCGKSNLLSNIKKMRFPNNAFYWFQSIYNGDLYDQNISMEKWIRQQIQEATSRGHRISLLHKRNRSMYEYVKNLNSFWNKHIKNNSINSRLIKLFFREEVKNFKKILKIIRIYLISLNIN